MPKRGNQASHYYSSELLSICFQTVRSGHTSLVDSVCRLVARVPRNLHLIVLNHVLLDNGLTVAKGGRLLDSGRVEVSLGDEAVVAGDVSRGLCRAHSQFMMFIALHFRLIW